MIETRSVSVPRSRRILLPPVAALLVFVFGAVGCPGKCGSSSTSGSVSKSEYFRPPTKKRVIIFVNGVFGDAKTTWTNGDTGAYWPDLLAKDREFDESDIYVHSFESPKLSNAKEILELAGQLKDYMDARDVIKNHDEIVFVSHSMGGLVTRAYLLKARVPASKLSFLFFFATPTNGANVADFGRVLGANPQLANMKPLGPDTYVKTLREEWLTSADEPTLDYPRKVSSYCAYEEKDTWGVKVVKEESACGLCNRATREIGANHLNIVKPADTGSEIYVTLLAAYKNQFGAAAQPIRMALAQQRNPKLLEHQRTFAIAEAASDLISLKQVKATRQYVDVGCGEEKTGEVEVAADLGPGESVFEVHPEIANVDNLKSSSALLVRFDGKTAVVAYKIRGLDRVFFNCPGGGHADVVVNFVVHGRRVLPPGAGRFDPGRAGHVPAAATLITTGVTPLVHPGVAMRIITPIPH